MTTAAPPARALKVLIAEDNTINLRLAVSMFKSLGHTRVVEGEGQKALQCLAKFRRVRRKNSLEPRCCL